ncbi:MAG: PAS domain S-box protein, partial [Armatimonadia bacterium]|nr:PAS domain S-box protein [Armatimonadia bacterium]
MLPSPERYLGAILQTTADGFWVIDNTGRVVEVNEAYCRMSGYTRDEIIGMSIGDLDADEPVEETAARIERIIGQGTELFEARHRRKDGTILPVEISSTYVDEGGGVFVCFCRDLSERKRTES